LYVYQLVELVGHNTVTATGADAILKMLIDVRFTAHRSPLVPHTRTRNMHP
jgi:hypothetical protein